MTLSELINQVRFKTNLTQEADLNSADIITFINIGYQNLVNEIVELKEDYFEKQRVTFDLAQNTSIYNLPSDCIKLKQVRLAYSTPTKETDYKKASELDIVEFEQPSDMDNITSSNPYYDITGNSIRIYPTPSAAVNSGGEFFYIARPSNLTAADTTASPAIPSSYHDSIADYSAWQICNKFEKFNQAAVYKQNYIDAISRIRIELANRNQDRRSRMKNILEFKTRKKPTALDLNE